MRTVTPFNQLPVEWQEHFTNLEALLGARNLQITILWGVVIGLGVLAFLIWFVNRKPRSLHVVATSEQTLVNLLNTILASGVELKDDLRCGIMIAGDVALVGRSIPERIGREGGSPSDARIRGMIMEQVDHGQGIALGIIRGDTTRLVLMDRPTYSDWRRKHRAPSPG